ncbi:MAG: VOC family protein [Caulobacteraceae bacterium]|nr:VOC family protein [Caulobacter sp.]
MFSHMMVGSNDLARSRTFYDAVFAALGAGPGMDDPRGRLIWSHANGRFLVTRPINGEPASGGNGVTIGFAAADPAQVDAWHAAGLAAGGQAIEDPPGERAFPGRRLYLAYLRDPDGNKLCALHALA